MKSPLHGLKVLVVEDDVIIAEAALMLLADVGAQAIGPCGTVSGALSALAEQDVDLALLDVDLNGMRSTAVAKALADKGVPYVAATGHIIAAAMAGAPVIVNKPYTPAKLRAALEGAAAG
jgi:CheY-like chemotaxis protein